ncbi:MAG TPA: hypothetical protein VIH99_01580 [Bdellovibrionota bacterium]|jgi:hypothetical protein
MKLKRIVFFLLMTSGCGALLAYALPGDDSPGRCYTFNVPSPARESDAPNRAERWCYRSVTGDNGGTFIFNGDGTKVRPELTLLKTTRGTISQGSLAQGTVQYYNAPDLKFSPFPAPLNEPRERAPDPVPLSAEFKESAEAALAKLQAASNQPVETERSDTSDYSVSANYMPWRGYWWPYKGMPMLGPLNKYDSYARNAASASGWESGHHRSHGIWWEGHCNGWAAAAILRSEPRSPSGEFGISDKKGLVTEADYCSPSSFFGYRSTGHSGVSPEEFHKALIHYIGHLHKPIAFNIRPDGPIDNRVISAYSMNIDRSGGGAVVTTRIRFHEYDGKRTEETGVAKINSATYRYSLRLDGDGNAIAGSWLSRRAGFVWVPLSTGGSCRSGNPNVSEAVVNDIVR